MSCEALLGSRHEALDQANSEPHTPATSDSAGWLELGKQVCGRYRVSSYLGSGSTGQVVAAEHLDLTATVALKFLHPELTTDPAATVRFLRNARKNLALSSEHIARVYDVDMHRGVPFLVTEALGTCDLRSWLEQRDRVSRETAVDYALQICDALAAAHALGIVHGNIKPENIFVVGSDTIKVVDFGMSARALGLEDDWREPQTRTSHVRLDAPLYLAPEQIRKSSVLDARSDIWSLGCVLYELLTGQPPFGRGGLIRTCVAILEQDPAPLSAQPYDFPEGLWRVVQRCLQKDPAARFADVAELAHALVPFAAEHHSNYAEQCRARLSANSASTPHADARSVVRYRAIPVTSEVSRAGIVNARGLKRSLQPLPSVSVHRTLALGAATSYKPAPTQPRSSPPAPAAVSGTRTASPAPEGAHRRGGLPSLVVLTVMCLLGLSAIYFVNLAEEPAGQPRLLHLVRPREQAPALHSTEESLEPEPDFLPSGALEPPSGALTSP